MSKYSGLLLAFTVVASVVLLNCTTPTSPPPASSCPPIGGGKKVNISDDPKYPNDGSSIEVYANNNAYTDPGNVPWCAADLHQLAISPVDLSTLPPCPYTNCLAAVDVKPDNIKFPPLENPFSSRPQLGYDLDEHPSQINPEGCGTSYCYYIYQLISGAWQGVGPAKPSPVGPEWHAIGWIRHFSIFALIELPDPNPIPGPRRLVMRVASEFIEDDQGDMSVSFIIIEDDLGELNQTGEQRIFRFSGVDPGSFEGDIPPDCPTLPAVAEQFTCLFPIETEVEFELDPEGQAVLRAPIRNYAVGFFVRDVEVY